LRDCTGAQPLSSDESSASAAITRNRFAFTISALYCYLGELLPAISSSLRGIGASPFQTREAWSFPATPCRPHAMGWAF